MSCSASPLLGFRCWHDAGQQDHFDSPQNLSASVDLHACAGAEVQEAAQEGGGAKAGAEDGFKNERVK